MRIAQVCPYSLSAPGGVQGQVLLLADALRRRGHDVDVIAPWDGPGPPPTGVVSVGRSFGVPANGSVAPIALHPSALRRTWRAVRDGGYDVVHLHEPLVPGPCMAALLRKGQPLVGTFHRAGDNGLYRAAAPLLRRLARRLDIRAAVSVDAASTAAGLLGGEYVTLWNGADADVVVPDTVIEKEGPAVVFVGRHEERKGLGVLLEAMAAVPEAAHVWVLSDGPQTGELKTLFANDSRIEWIGRVDDAQRAVRLANADVFCAPSLRGESFGVVLLEAMVMGTPIVASDLPGYRNVARPDEEAVLAPPGDVRALTDAIRRVLADGHLSQRLSEAGRERSRELSMATLADRYLDIYDRTR